MYLYMLHICLMVGPLEWEINFKNLYWLERQLYVGHCGQAEIIWCLKILRLKLICKFCTKEHIVYDFERSYKGMRSKPRK
jgi:hypothetical protein